MMPNEIAELMQSTCVKLFDAVIMRTGELMPRSIAGQPGFEPDFEFVSGGEVIRRAFIGGTVKDGKLQAVIYQAACMRYDAKDFAAARALIVTASLPWSPPPAATPNRSSSGATPCRDVREGACVSA